MKISQKIKFLQILKLVTIIYGYPVYPIKLKNKKLFLSQLKVQKLLANNRKISMYAVNNSQGS